MLFIVGRNIPAAAQMLKQHFKDVMHLISPCPMRTSELPHEVKWFSCRHSDAATVEWRERDIPVSSNKPRVQEVSKNAVTGWSKVHIIASIYDHSRYHCVKCINKL